MYNYFKSILFCQILSLYLPKYEVFVFLFILYFLLHLIYFYLFYLKIFNFYCVSDNLKFYCF